MITLKNIPDNYKSAYTLLVELYSKYGQIYDQATNSTGSLTSYNNDVNTRLNDFNEIYDKIKVLVPEVASKSE